MRCGLACKRCLVLIAQFDLWHFGQGIIQNAIHFKTENERWKGQFYSPFPRHEFSPELFISEKSRFFLFPQRNLYVFSCTLISKRPSFPSPCLIRSSVPYYSCVKTKIHGIIIPKSSAISQWDDLIKAIFSLALSFGAGFEQDSLA